VSEIEKDREVAELAAQARAHITSHGWRQGDYWAGAGFDKDRYDGGPVCLLGGAAVAAKITGATHVGAVAVSDCHPLGRLARTVCTVLDIVPGPSTSVIGQIGEWNDADDRAEHEVLALLDEVATKAMPDEAPGA
jgi:hypothetical protein